MRCGDEGGDGRQDGPSGKGLSILGGISDALGSVCASLFGKMYRR